jgi:flagellar biosynthesis/type III secretory pathway protein FliH
MEKGMEKGMKKGVEEGVKQGQQKQAQSLVLRMLRKRLGTLEEHVQNRIMQLPVEQLEELAEALLDFASPSDLTAWLDTRV